MRDLRHHRDDLQCMHLIDRNYSIGYDNLCHYDYRYQDNRMYHYESSTCTRTTIPSNRYRCILYGMYGNNFHYNDGSIDHNTYDNSRNDHLKSSSPFEILVIFLEQIPIGYSVRFFLRDRITLRGLAYRRNPWTYGENVSHILYRYSCQHFQLWYLKPTLQFAFFNTQGIPLPS